MPAMDFCNTMEFPIAILWIFNLQLSVFLSYNKYVGLCLTAFLQATILIAGLMVFNSSMLLGLGLMLAASEIPRIAGQFGLDTSTRGNLMSTIYAAQTAMNMTRTIVRAVAK